MCSVEFSSVSATPEATEDIQANSLFWCVCSANQPHLADIACSDFSKILLYIPQDTRCTNESFPCYFLNTYCTSTLFQRKTGGGGSGRAMSFLKKKKKYIICKWPCQLWHNKICFKKTTTEKWPSGLYCSVSCIIPRERFAKTGLGWWPDSRYWLLSKQSTYYMFRNLI